MAAGGELEPRWRLVSLLLAKRHRPGSRVRLGGRGVIGRGGELEGSGVARVGARRVVSLRRGRHGSDSSLALLLLDGSGTDGFRQTQRLSSVVASVASTALGGCGLVVALVMLLLLLLGLGRLMLVGVRRGLGSSVASTLRRTHLVDWLDAKLAKGSRGGDVGLLHWRRGHQVGLVDELLLLGQNLLLLGLQNIDLLL